MKKLILITAILLVGCSTEELELRPEPIYNLSFNLKSSTPSLQSKIPDCKTTGEPNMVYYGITNEEGQEFIYSAPITLENGSYVSNEPVSLPNKTYTLNSIELGDGNDTYYSVPDFEEDIEILPYADLVLPIDFTMDKDVNISSKVFCYVPSEQPDIENVIEGGFVPNQLGTMWIYVRDAGCTQFIYIYADAQLIEITVLGPGIIQVAIPYTGFYDSLGIWSEDGNRNQLDDGYSFSSENPYDVNSILVIDNTCN